MHNLAIFKIFYVGFSFLSYFSAFCSKRISASNIAPDDVPPIPTTLPRNGTPKVVTPKQRPISYHPRLTTENGVSSVRLNKRAKRTSSYEEVDFLPRNLTLNTDSEVTIPEASAAIEEDLPHDIITVTDSDADSLGSDPDYAVLEAEEQVGDQIIQKETGPVDIVQDRPEREMTFSSQCNGDIAPIIPEASISSCKAKPAITTSPTTKVATETTVTTSNSVSSTSTTATAVVQENDEATMIGSANVNGCKQNAVVEENEEETFEDDEGYVEVEHEFTHDRDVNGLTSSTEDNDDFLLVPTTTSEIIRANSCQQLLQEDISSDNELICFSENTDGNRLRSNSNEHSRAAHYEPVFITGNNKNSTGAMTKEGPPVSLNENVITGDLICLTDEDNEVSDDRLSKRKKIISSAPISSSPDTIELLSGASTKTSETSNLVYSDINEILQPSKPKVYTGGARPRDNKNYMKLQSVTAVASEQRDHWVAFEDSNTNCSNQRPNSKLDITSNFEDKFATPRLADLESSKLLPPPETLKHSSTKPKVNPNHITSRTDMPCPTTNTDKNEKRLSNKEVVDVLNAKRTTSNSQKATFVNHMLFNEFPPFTTTPQTNNIVAPITTTSTIGATTSLVTTSTTTATPATQTTTPSSTSNTLESTGITLHSRNKEGRRSMRSKKGSRKTSRQVSATESTQPTDIVRAISVSTTPSQHCEPLATAASATQFETPPPLPPRENNPKRIFETTDGRISESPVQRRKPEITPHGSNSSRTRATRSDQSAESSPSSSSSSIPRDSSRGSTRARHSAKQMSKISSNGSGRSTGERQLPTSKYTSLTFDDVSSFLLHNNFLNTAFLCVDVIMVSTTE